MSPSQKKVSVFNSDYNFLAGDGGVPNCESDLSLHLIHSNSRSVCPSVFVYSERPHAHSSRPGEAADERAF